MPATALTKFISLPPQIERLSGSLWHGLATLEAGYTLAWDVSLGSLLLGRVTADVELSGVDTMLTGQISASPWRVALRDVSGRAGPGLLVLVPDLAVDACTSRIVVSVPWLALSRNAAAAEGTITLDSGICTATDGAEIPLPAMLLALDTEGSDATADLTDAAAAPLARIVVAGDRRLILRLEPAGASLIPGLPTSGPLILEFPF